jgi:hypothetical protein
MLIPGATKPGIRGGFPEISLVYSLLMMLYSGAY